MPKGTLLRRWNDWSAGIGHLVDDGRTPGMSYTSGLLGLRGELRPAPFLNVVTSSIFKIFLSYRLSASVAWKQAACSIAPASGSSVAIFGASSSDKDNGTTLTYSHTVPSVGGDNIAIYVIVHNDSNADPSSVTYAGDALTRVVGITTTTERVSIWRRVNPSRASNDVVITFAGGTDIISEAVAFSGVHQSTPETDTNSDNNSNSGPVDSELDAETGGAAITALSYDDTAKVVTFDHKQVALDFATQGTMAGAASYRTFTQPDHHFQYFFEATADTDIQHPFLYTLRGSRFVVGVALHKIDLSNADFANFEAGSLTVGTSHFPGQSAKYEGFWWIPASNDNTPRKLSVVGVGDTTTDTLDAPASPFVPGADHLVAFGNQLAGHVREKIAGIPGFQGLGAQDGGVRILTVGGAPATAGDWGSPFPVGDVTDRAAGMVNLQGATFVLMPDGLYSFNSKGRSGLVHGDLGAWENAHNNIPLSTYKGSIVIPHPSGLLLYTLGEEPINIGVDRGSALGSMPASGVTELHGGIHHSTDTVADFIYEVYQPDSSSTKALLLCGYQVDRSFVWQSLGTLTLPDAEVMLGCKVARNSRPDSASYVTPTLWSQSGVDLVYMKLDPAASPFHARSDAHKVTASADAYMSELRFTEPVDLTELVVHTSKDMVSGDEFQISLLVNGTGDDIDVGPPVRGSGTRHVRTIDRKKGGKNVTSLVLHVNWVATSTANRVPPVIQSIELYGKPSVGGEEE